MKCKNLLLNIAMILASVLFFFIIEIHVPENIPSMMTNLTIILALFTLITTYLIRYQEVKIDILTILMLGVSFLLIIVISFLTSTEILALTPTIYKLIVSLTILYILYIIIVFALFYFNKFLYREFELVELKQSKLIKKFKKTRTNDTLNASLDFLCRWVDKNRILKNTFSMAPFFDILEDILIEGVKSNIINKLTDGPEDFKWKEILMKSFETSIRQNRKDFLIKYLSSLQKIIDSTVKIENWTLVEEFNEFLYKDIYEFCLQEDMDFAEKIVLHYVNAIKKENISKYEEKNALTKVLVIILTQMQKYDYNVTEFSIDLLYQEILGNNCIYIDVLGVEHAILRFYQAFKICKEVHKTREMFFEYHKLDLFVKSFDTIEKRIEVIKVIAQRFNNKTDKIFSDFINVAYFDLFLSFREQYSDIFSNQIEAMSLQEISGSEMEVELLYEFAINHSVNNKDNYIIKKFAALFEYQENSFASLFSKLIMYTKKKSITEKELKNLLYFFSVFIKTSFGQTQSNLHESLIIGLHRFYLFLLDKYSGESYKDYRKVVFDNYTKLIGEIYNYSNQIESKKLIVNLLMDFESSDRESERNKTIKVVLEVGYRSLEEANHVITESVSNILGWSLFSMLKKIEKGDSCNPDYSIISKINSFFENVVKFSGTKTSIFVGTVYAVNYVFCDLHSQRNRSIKKYMDKLDNYFKHNASCSALETIQKSVTLRSNFIHSYYEEYRQIDEETIDNSCKKLMNIIESAISIKSIST